MGILFWNPFFRFSFSIPSFFFSMVVLCFMRTVIWRMDDGDDVRKWNDAESHADDLFTVRTNKHIYGRICIYAAIVKNRWRWWRQRPRWQRPKIKLCVCPCRIPGSVKCCDAHSARCWSKTQRKVNDIFRVATIFMFSVRFMNALGSRCCYCRQIANGLRS